ncbi:ABC transporter ATP-binding protein [Amycolatopsis sp. GM8]|uniref:ABC transporter ATP-binding protein n=1 Tax=Amycolatopsis sp. GM8 TaxID=2896530 RepID=UPI001F30E9A2|nr:ABC transporter ATP-binding protein [Amycolatopsis sp. GM8]
MTAGDLLLKIEDLKVTASVAGVDTDLIAGVSLNIPRARIIGVIGESGSGKTTLARSIIGLLESNVRVSGGGMTLEGEPLATARDFARIRGAKVGLIMQEAKASLDPLIRIDRQMREVARQHRDRTASIGVAGHADLLERLGFLPSDIQRVMRSYPHELSGGMAQRIAIALALIPGPSMLIADECTSALDVTTQAEVVTVIQGLVTDLGLSILFVTHDLSLAAGLCDELVVMHRGEVVELGATSSMISAPEHPYTQSLLAAR